MSSYMIMGPAVCKQCRALVWWGRRDGLLMWVGRNGRKHYCGQ